MNYRIMIYKYLWIVPFFLGLLIALLSPLNILDYKLPNFLVLFMSQLIPMIGKLKGEYAMTQLTQLYFSSMWLMSPAILMSFVKGEHFDKEKMAINLQKKNLLPIAIILFCLTLIWFCIFIGPDVNDLYDVRTNVALKTRLGLASYGFLIPMGAAAAVAALIALRNYYKSITNE